MREKDIRYLLSQLGVDLTKVDYTGGANGRWMNIRCPFAQWTHSDGYDSNPSFGVSLHDDTYSHYRCFSCNAKGRFAGLPSRLGGYRKIDYSKLREWAEAVETSGIAERPLPDWEETSPAIDYSSKSRQHTVNIVHETALSDFPLAIGLPYLSKRNITFLDVLKMQLRYDPIQQRVLFPVYDDLVRLRGFTGRSIMPAETYNKYNPKVRDYHKLNKLELFLHLRNIPVNHKSIIVEGLFDYGSGIHHGYYGTRAVMGTAATPEKVRILLNRGEPVYLLFDNDLPGWQAMFGIPDKDGNLVTKNAWAFLLYQEIPVWIVPYRKNFDGSDPGSLPKSEWDAMLDHAWMFNGRAPLDADGKPIMVKPKWASTK